MSADVGSIQIFCRIRLTENLRWINKWVLIEIINTNRNKEKVTRSLFLASTSWLENVCYLAKEIINAKIVWKWKMLMFTTKWKMLMFTTIFSYQTYEPVARGKCPILPLYLWVEYVTIDKDRKTNTAKVFIFIRKMTYLDVELQ